MMFRRYLFLQYKKSLKQLMKMLTGLIVMLLLSAMAVFMVSQVMFKSQMLNKVDVGIVMPRGSSELKMAVKFVSAMDSVKSVCRFKYLKEDKAMSMLKKEKLGAVIVLPENFYEDINEGKNTPATVYFPYNTELSTQVFAELTRDGISLLQTAEAGVYATLDIAADYKSQVIKDNIGDFIAWKYASLAMDRNSVFKQHIISPTGESGISQYYFIALMIIFLLMTAMNLGFLYEKESRAVEEKLKIYGIGSLQQTIIKVLVIASFLWIWAAFIYTTAGIITWKKFDDVLIYKWQRMFGLFPVCLSMAGYIHLIYSIAGNSRQGAGVLLCSNILILLCSGTIVPVMYFPKLIRSLCSHLPFDFWNHLCEKILFGSPGAGGWLIVAGVIVLETGLGAVAEWKNI